MAEDNYWPRAYDLNDPDERMRLISEVSGYMTVSRKHGTDTEGRAFAIDALRELREGMRDGTLAIVKIVQKENPPFVFDEERDQ